MENKEKISKKEKKIFNISRKKEETLKQLAIDIVENKVFTDRNLNEKEYDKLFLIFIPLMFLQKEDKLNWKEELGMFYEYYDKAYNRNINGNPIFYSMQLFHIKDLDLLQIFIDNYVIFKNTFIDNGK